MDTDRELAIRMRIENLQKDRQLIKEDMRRVREQLMQLEIQLERATDAIEYLEGTLNQKRTFVKNLDL